MATRDPRLETRDRSSPRRRRGTIRILVYGFGPYLQYRQNVTTKILRKFPRQVGLKKIIFPVRFDKRQFVEAVRGYLPDVIVGLGQCSRGRLLRIESRAVNRRRKDAKSRATPIVLGGPGSLPTTLELNLGRKAAVSRQAGHYVCNYSMYVLLDFLERHRLPVRFGFVHIPHDYDPATAADILWKRIGHIKSSAATARPK